MHDHLIRNIDNRLIWPRGLTIYGPTRGAAWEPPDLNALVGIFEHARELKVLEVHRCEEAICCNTLVGEYLAALPDLSHIRLFDIEAKTSDVLHKMISYRPETACLSLSISILDRHLLRIAEAAVLGSVKRLRLSNFQFGSTVSERQLISKLAGAYPQLEVLDLDLSAVYPCLILFPNIRRLTILSPQVGPQDPGRHVEQRHLDYVSVQPKYLRLIPALGIRSDYLRLTNERQNFCPAEVDPEHVSAAAVLELSLYQVERCTEFCMALAQTISAKSSRIRYLIWTITTEDAHAAMTQWMENVSPSLSSSQLCCIRVHVVHQNNRGPSRETWLGLLQRLERVHISSIPSLRFYFQHVEGIDDQSKPSGPSKTTWGRVEGDGSDRAVQPIPSWQGERIHRYLQSPEFCRTLQFDEEAALRRSGR
ncbi:uncharacterized protein B0H18DRAFT_445771 [Fomitopsis serialis]|uniref:uncharacterized protein n=1 Tax=Fomitopsis serialis TaxID=139415 RepID=UPI002007E039|nr:uncharacterized protein B0H18DRAFT_445771 [Neoantrodia serialis]KAH9924072.1 hypothetical protein B0H18DRAFT_445771 [Neoantrodia serialis]